MHVKVLHYSLRQCNCVAPQSIMTTFDSSFAGDIQAQVITE